MECIEFKPMDKGFFKGFATIFVEKWGVEISGVRLFQKGDRKWVSMPSREYQDNTGETKYWPTIKFRSDAHQKAFEKSALESVLAYAPAPAASPLAQDEELPF